MQPYQCLRIEKGHGKEIENVHLKGQKDEGINSVIDMETDAGGGKGAHAAFVGHAHLFVPCSGREEKSAGQGARGHEKTH